MLGLVPSQSQGTGWASAHLSRVEGGWLLMWGEEVWPLFPEEVDLVEGEGRALLRITLKDHVLLFLWGPEGPP